jgi:hypothetical protein
MTGISRRKKEDSTVEKRAGRVVNGVRCLHALVCEAARLEPDGTTTLVSLFTRITTARLPLTRRLCYACFLELDLAQPDRLGRETVEIGLRIHSPLGAMLHNSGRQARFVSHAFEAMRCCLTIPVDELSFSDYGDYVFELYLDDEFLHREVLTVKPDRAR